MNSWKIEDIKLVTRKTIKPLLEKNGCFDITCSYCKESLESSSICYKHRNLEDRILIGECKHAFHEVCIKKWTEEQNTCPNCTQPWNVLEISKNT